MDGRGRRGEGAGRDRPQEIGVVVDPDHRALLPSTLARQTNADTLATLSTTEQYTPPCTIPWGCRRFSVMARLAVTPSGVSEVYSSPTSLSKGAVGILLNCSGVSDI